MRATFMGFEVQKRTLMMAQKNQDIVGNNISNINTPGYTRQRVDMYSVYVSGLGEARWSSRTNMLSMQGQGVNAYGVSQIRDVYIDKRYRENVAVEAETDKRITILGELEDIMDNFETTGLQTKTKDFWAALQDYSEEKPDSTEVATIAVNAAVNLCRMLNDYHQRICEVEDTYVNELQDTLGYINKLLNEMTDLNEKIEKEKFHYADNYGPNELYDQMNLYIDELATYGEIEFWQNKNGTFDVKMGGVQIVYGEELKNQQIYMKDYSVYGVCDLYFESGQDVILQTGMLKGYQDMLNGNGVYASGGQSGAYGIPYFKSCVNVYARTLAEILNTANGAEQDASRTMFESSNGDVLITAGNIKVSDNWREDPTMIGKVRYLNEKTGMYEYGFNQKTDTPVTQVKYKKQLYKTNYDGTWVLDANNKQIPAEEGDKYAQYDYVFDANGNPVPERDAAGNLVYETVDQTASGEVNLQNTNVKYLFSQFDNKHIVFGNCHDFSGSFFEYISFVSNRLGQTIEYETARNETAVITVDELLDARDAVSAPQMDEEGINMLNYTKWYNASARMVTALDDMLDKLINGTGRVGL